MRIGELPGDILGWLLFLSLYHLKLAPYSLILRVILNIKLLFNIFYANLSIIGTAGLVYPYSKWTLIEMSISCIKVIICGYQQ